jgi:hypothetical protein
MPMEIPISVRPGADRATDESAVNDGEEGHVS